MNNMSVSSQYSRYDDPSCKLAQQVLGNSNCLINIGRQGGLSALISIRSLNKKCLAASNRALEILYNTLIKSKFINECFNELSENFNIENVKNSIIGEFNYKKITDSNGLLAVLGYKSISHILFGHLSVNDIPVSVEKFEKKLHESFESIEKCWDNGLEEIIIQKGFTPIKEECKNSGLGIRTFFHKTVNNEKEYNNLKTIKVFSFKDLALKMFPFPPCAMEGLKELSLMSNQLEIFPVLHLENLEGLELFNNKLTSIDLSYCPNLKRFHAEHNQLIEFPKGIGKLVNLRHLGLASNKLTQIPKEIGELVNLNYLYVNNNKLTQIPKEIRKLVNLWWLSVSNNKLAEIPKEIGALKKLKCFYLDKNDLTELPEEIGQLEHLEHLEIQGNELKKITDQMRSLKNLETLCLPANCRDIVPENFFNGISKLKEVKWR